MFLIPFGLFFAGVPTVVVSGFFAAAVGPFGMFAGLFALPFLGIGLVCALIGALLVWGRTEVCVAGGRLLAIERLGPFRITRRRDTAWVEELQVVGDGFRVNNRPVTSASGEEFAVLRAAGESGRPFIITAMYPRPALVALAQELSRECDAATPDALFGADAPRVVEIASEHTDEPGSPVPLVERPADSRIELTRDDTSLTFRLPPPGLMRGSKGFFIFAIFWNAFLTLMTGGFAYALFFQAGGVNVNGPKWAPFAILSVFWLVGVWMLIWSISLGRRFATIDVVGDTLLITEQRLRRTKQWEWRAADLASIRVGPSGTEVNNKPVNCLLIEPTVGRTRKLFMERRDEDLAWIADTLRRALPLAGASTDAAT